ncbi:hypothetical protein ASPZODRAFT_128257 [Penicilliopsis zonata CBS 506.65]|uniref:SET domain-containing protein n=1 Tax=Penicilliopsis zonata CBS 506.65 TaxID=1073090 RepID=A0A1L9SRN8_9EURO|nr:hypothetical protein ASPZODRAFT_128257 [Penicilliopsis zonata CBS 506.65]OJJ49741.1 hypothetical protein ASPZODRAFT_128257 [Penicilliopsis zonata CBS 506.65]
MTMVIDLTQDSDPEEPQNKALSSIISTLPHRTISSLQLPLKRKSRGSDDDESSSIVSAGGTSRTTPALEEVTFSVVVPSPSRALQQKIEYERRRHPRQPRLRGSTESSFSSGDYDTTPLMGLSQRYYPVDEQERKKASRAVYPPAKQPILAPSLRLRPRRGHQGPFLCATVQGGDGDPLVHTLHQKIASIKGPRVDLAPGVAPKLAGPIMGFEFINSYKIQRGVTKVDEAFNFGCSCSGSCDPATCLCLSLDEKSNNRIVPYKEVNGTHVLAPDFLQRTSMIYECNANCGCKETCWNRVVQRGRTIRLQIFDTGNRGFGLRSPDQIIAGQFIDLYLGEVIPKNKADRREELAASQNGHSYLFGLDFFHDDEGIYVVDGQRLGSPARFMNHSCNPTCKMFPVASSQGDDRLYNLAFFALRDIPQLQELTFDYNPNWEHSKTTKVDPNAVKCLCGELQCRGQLWPNQRKGTK